MPVVQFRHMQVIMGEGRVPMHVSMRFMMEWLSLMPVVVMSFVHMDVVVF